MSLNGVAPRPAALSLAALLLLSLGNLHLVLPGHRSGLSIEPLTVGACHADREAHVETGEIEDPGVCQVCAHRGGPKGPAGLELAGATVDDPRSRPGAPHSPLPPSHGAAAAAPRAPPLS